MLLNNSHSQGQSMNRVGDPTAIKKQIHAIVMGAQTQAIGCESDSMESLDAMGYRHRPVCHTSTIREAHQKDRMFPSYFIQVHIYIFCDKN